MSGLSGLVGSKALADCDGRRQTVSGLVRLVSNRRAQRTKVHWTHPSGSTLTSLTRSPSLTYLACLAYWMTKHEPSPVQVQRQPGPAR